MPTLELLNSVVHATVRMAPAERIDSPIVRLVRDEIVEAAATCPVLLSKHADTGAFYIGALQGFAEGEHLVASPDGKPAFRAAERDREGFFASGENIALDREHARFLGNRGDSLFDGQGQPTIALKSVQRALGRLMAGAQATDAFIAALITNKLVEPIDISLSFDDGERLNLEGLYTVSLDSLDDLDDAAALALFRAGHLQCAYAMVASLHHIALMARRRNASLATA